MSLDPRQNAAAQDIADQARRVQDAVLEPPFPYARVAFNPFFFGVTAQYIAPANPGLPATWIPPQPLSLNR